MSRFKVIVHWKRKPAETHRNQTSDQVENYKILWIANKHLIRGITIDLEPDLKIVK